MCVLLGVFREFPVDPYYEPLAWFMIRIYWSLSMSPSVLHIYVKLDVQDLIHTSAAAGYIAQLLALGPESYRIAGPQNGFTACQLCIQFIFPVSSYTTDFQKS